MNDSYSLVFATEQIGNLTVEVLQDTDPFNPRTEWDNDSLMVCFHKRYNLGDSNTGYKENDFDDWHQVYEQLRIDGYQTILALWLYDHSGIAISAKSFIGRAQHAEWDSGQIGFIASKEPNFEKQLIQDVEIYDSYLQGNVYSYRIFDENEVYVYTGGYYSVEEALSAGKEEAPYYEKVGA